MAEATPKIKHTAKPTRIITCPKKCASTYQDEQWGKGNRLHNPYAKGWRCTVCGNEIVTTE